MLHRSLHISFRALFLLPTLALAACDPKLTLGELFGDEEGQGDDSSDEGQGEDGQSDDGQGDDSGASNLTPGTTTEGEGSASDSSGGDSSSGQTSGGDSSGGSEATGDPDVCDVWAQDCPANEKCAPYSTGGGASWDATMCVPIDPTPVPVGAPCQNPGSPADGLDNCEEGAMCWDVDPDTGFGTCVAHCQGSPQAPICATGFDCLIANDGVLPVCLPGCDVLAQDCVQGNVCVPVNGSFNCVLDASGDEGQAFDPCEFLNACDPGLACMNSTFATECDSQGNGCCLPFCDIDDPNACPGVGQECLPWYPVGEAPVGDEDIGLCRLPG